MLGSTVLDTRATAGSVATPAILGIWAAVQLLVIGTLAAGAEKLLHPVL